MKPQAERRAPIALITGASSGIGEAYARILASRGYRLVLVARRADRLDALAGELQTAHGIEAASLPADLSKPGDTERVAACIGELPPLTLQINNAGFGNPGLFHEIDPKSHTDMVAVHCTATVRLARAALPKMVSRRGGAVINVSSIAGILGEAGGPMYGATKAFLVRFSKNLASELRGTGVGVQALCPGLTRTEFHDGPGYEDFDRQGYPNWLWMEASDVVIESLAEVERGKVVVVPGLRYRVLLALVNNPLGRLIADRYTDRRAGRK
jgi:hypothetical protein